MHLYTENNYTLWLKLESDSRISVFNECVEDVPVATPDGKVIFIKPRAVSVDHQNVATIHTFGGLDLNCELDSADKLQSSIWTDWVNSFGFKSIIWTAESLNENPTEIKNIKRILRFTSNASYFPDLKLQDALISELSSLRKVTVATLVKLFPRVDDDDVVREICNLLIDKRIYSDIGYRPFDLLTELSAHGEVREM